MTKYNIIIIIGITVLLLVVSFASTAFAYPEGNAGGYWWGSHGFSWYRPSFWDFFHFWY
jgi:hypothetical protein